MKNISRGTKQFIKKNGSTMLSGLAAVGVVATAVATAKAVPKAIALLEEAKEEKGDELTKMEIVQIATPAYIPAIALGFVTVSSIIGVSILNKKQQASLISGYVMLEQTFKQYRNKVDELYGEGSDEEILEEVAKDNVEDESKASKLFYDERSGQFFESTPFNVQLAEYQINRNIMINGGACLNEWFDEIGIDILPAGEDLGWSSFMLMEMYWQPWLDFNHEKKVTDDGQEYISISFWQEPIEDYGDY